MGVVAAGAVSGSRRRKPRRRHSPMAEINVTPFVDVMLVLLIIFMVTAPLLTVGVPVDQPQAQGEALGTDTEPLNVTVDADGKIFLQEAEVTADQLFTTIQAMLAEDPEKRIILSGSKDADYGMVAVVLAKLREAGSKHVALQTRALGGSDT
jgi:biopolymer transport protein TolR